METKTSSNPQRVYALGHSEPELERLSRQGEAFGPFTRHLFEQAGIKPGMRVLDIGSGSGDVAFLVASLVGPEGQVLGVDRASNAVRWAQARANARGSKNVAFLEGDPTTMQFDEKFDAVVGRLVLMYYADPVTAVRRLADNVRPGGLLVFQEFDCANCRSHPPCPLFEKAIGWLRQTLSATGARIQVGLELYSVFSNAGLPGPLMRMDSLIGGGPDVIAYDLITEVLQSLLPVMAKLNIASPEEVDVPTLAQRLREEVVAAEAVVLSPGLIGAWSVKPPETVGPVAHA